MFLVGTPHNSAVQRLKQSYRQIIMKHDSGKGNGTPVKETTRGGLSMESLLQQSCFNVNSTQVPPLLFMSFSDGKIEGGQLPAGTGSGYRKITVK